MRRNKFKKYLKNINELKASKDSKKMIEYVLIKLNKIKCELIIISLNKKNNNKLKHNNDCNLLYNLVASEIAKNLNIKNNIRVYIDKSKNQREIEKFNNIFLNSIKNPKNHNIEIYHEKSYYIKGLQIVDYLAWSYFQKYEKQNNSFVRKINKTCIIIEI